MHSLCPSLPVPALGGQAPQGYMILGKILIVNTVAVLAQGTRWAVAPAQAYFPMAFQCFLFDFQKKIQCEM